MTATSSKIYRLKIIKPVYTHQHVAEEARDWFYPQVAVTNSGHTSHRRPPVY